MSELTDERLRELLAGLGDDEFVGIRRKVDVYVSEARTIITELLARRHPVEAGEMVAGMRVPSGTVA